ncbi:hypothetical protein V6615_00290 [Oscillospiraceae bacterium PP1C4]
MRVAIIGSREIGNFSVESMIPHIPQNASELVSGGAIGIDSLAEKAAILLELPIKIFLPDYDTNGRLAPLFRNLQIVDYADLVLAFWDNQSRGTAHALNHCVQTSKPFRIISLHSTLI